MTNADLLQLQRDVRLIRDRQEILDCIVREARGRDRHDVALTSSAFWPDAVDEHGPIVTAAAAYAERANAGHAMFFSATQHNICNHTCEIDGDVAHCETYVAGTLMAKDEQTCILAPGRYLDRMERRGGEWRIAFRRTTVEMSLQGSTEFARSRACQGFARGEWSHEDTSYTRPLTLESPTRRW
ncbi:MAG: nuclear transport factor 2 family protein [Novosphingobium sp.]